MWQWVRNTLGNSNRDDGTAHFLGRLKEEAERSLRYNHFFTVAIIASYRTSPDDICGRVKALLRQSDCVEVIDADKDDGTRMLRAGRGATSRSARALKHRWVVVVLPETNREAAHSALRRLKGALGGADDVLWGVAVYPDDAATPTELLKAAAPRNARAVGGVA